MATPDTRLPSHGVFYALLAAALFGASTPLAKLLVGDVPPLLLAGLLYLGSGAGLIFVYLVRRTRSDSAPPLAVKDVPWLAGAILSGGILAPVLLLVGLTTTPGAAASLLLNLEGVFTALLAWFVFRENFDRRVAVGMALIVAGGVVLAWQGSDGFRLPTGALAVAGACFLWGVDNNLTQKVSGGDPILIAAAKGLAAGGINLALALGTGAALPGWPTAVGSAAVGLMGYGASLCLFILGLRHLGTARTGAYFSVAPFVGAAVSVPLLGERPGASLVVAACLMAAGVWLHLTEEHRHAHRHASLEHSHFHEHDDHHDHEHDHDAEPGCVHCHWHVHRPIVHAHRHYPDIHHRHGHEDS